MLYNSPSLRYSVTVTDSMLGQCMWAGHWGRTCLPFEEPHTHRALLVPCLSLRFSC